MGTTWKDNMFQWKNIMKKKWTKTKDVHVLLFNVKSQ